MSTPILATKLYIPPPRPGIVLRPRLIERLNEGLRRKVTLISASAGFGKTTLIGEWVATLSPLPLGDGKAAHARAQPPFGKGVHAKGVHSDSESGVACRVCRCSRPDLV